MKLTLASLDSTMRDMYPLPGARIKQWVVEHRAVMDWERQTEPTILVPSHRDNTDFECNNVGRVTWSNLHHCECDTCDALLEAAERTPECTEWLAERAKRLAAVEPDHSKLSDQIQPQPEPLSIRKHPLLAMLPRKP